MNSKSNFTKKCSQTLAHPALYRHSFHRDLDLAIQSLLGGVCKGLNSLLFEFFAKGEKSINLRHISNLRQKTHSFKVQFALQICGYFTLLRKVQYDKNKSVWQSLGVCLNFCGKVCFFMPCHAKFACVLFICNDSKI